ncbi:MAG: peptidase M64 [Ignavibacteria bacterium GWB2_35_12]|nr:MAG: peptidase M64 [Ignavibacteria bacterium GWB2_35_12]OGU93075.1 MAG: peptidase M64 [Ignavibacteria bacterium RIFOXYA2_FULL_35_10]OGV24726.1 MAG: peptidase M64 [Ignavibacteria bacterium RIFOXYC2_FULL_35_21]
MKKLSTTFLFIFVLTIVTSFSQVKFDDYFIDKTLRIDYLHIGNAKTESIVFDKAYEYGMWAGSTKNTIDNFNNGRYYCKVYDVNSGILIFSKGYDTYFGEYRTTTPAINGQTKAYHESVLIPMPNNKIKYTIESRTKEQKLVQIYQTEIDPSDINIIRDNIIDKAVRVYKSHVSGNPHNKVDVVIISEGYDSNEDMKFLEDMKRFTGVFFSQEPYKTYQDKFNIYGIYKPSEESGIDIPLNKIYKKTTVNATFNSLGSDRYLLTDDNKTLRDVAAHAPYDAIYIMVNTSKYGGGGIYNQYATFVNNNVWNEYVFLHEFGHAFAGLGDEYYTSDVSYNDFYPKGIEPTEPNLTALINKDDLKWREFITSGIELPSLWEKAEYEKLDKEWGVERVKLLKNISDLKSSNASESMIKLAEQDYQTAEKKRNDNLDKFFKNSKYAGKVGVYEGGGYSSQGIYRPMVDCIMFSKGKKPYCNVCENAILNMIKFYTE